MGSYILVEKDSKVMQKCWKWLIIFLLITILITCILSSYAISALGFNFNGNCVTGSELTFKRYPSNGEALTETAKKEGEFYSHKSAELYKEFRLYYLTEESRDIDGTKPIPKVQIDQFLNNGPGGTSRTGSYMVPTIPENDSDFFKNYQINEKATIWGDDTCSFYYYFPVIEITVAMVWIVLILISRGKGERRSFTVIHKAWRLVIPAVVCFGVLAICCCIYAAYLNSHLNSFCDQFKHKFTNHEIPCRLNLQRFSMNDATAFTSATNFYMAKSIAYIRIFLWLLAGFVMLLRCILGADFEMQEVEYCTEQLGAAFDPQTDHPSRVKFIDDGIRRYSKERVYKPTTELQRLD